MGASTRGRLRRLWFNLHLCLGVGLALATIPLGLSGSYLVWRDEIDRAANPVRYAVGPGAADLDPSAYLQAAQGAFGDRARAVSLRLPDRAGDPVAVSGAVVRSGDGPAPRRGASLSAWIDPATARVLDVADPSRPSFSMWVHDLHGQFFAFGGAGRQAVGWVGWAMLASCLTGIWLWRPRAGSFFRGLRWGRTGDALVNLHHMVGFWIAIPLAVLSLTGALISFPPVARSVAGLAGPVTPPRVGGPGGPGGQPLRRTALDADQALAQAVAAYPGANLQSLTLPVRSKRGEPEWRLQMRGAGGDRLELAVPDADGGAVKAQPARQSLAGDRLIQFNRQSHSGVGAPLVWKLIITLGGLAPALLAGTGTFVWARRQARKARLRNDVGAAPEAAPAE